MTTTSSLVAQMYETEGMSHFAYVNVTSILTNQKSSSGDIRFISGHTLNSLEYEFADSDYKWDQSRDLKAREPFFSSGDFYENDQNTLKGAVKKILNAIHENLHSKDIDDATIQKAHKMGLDSAMMPMFAMNYE